MFRYGGANIFHEHINPLAGVSGDCPLVARGAGVGGGTLEVVQIGPAVRTAAEKFCGDRLIGLQRAIVEKILIDRSGLSSDDGRKIPGSNSRGVETLLNLRHGLLSGQLGEAGGGVLPGEILCGDLLDSRGGKERDCDGGQQGSDQQDKDKRAAGFLF